MGATRRNWRSTSSVLSALSVAAACCCCCSVPPRVQGFVLSSHASLPRQREGGGGQQQQQQQDGCSPDLRFDGQGDGGSEVGGGSGGGSKCVGGESLSSSGVLKAAKKSTTTTTTRRRNLTVDREHTDFALRMKLREQQQQQQKEDQEEERGAKKKEREAATTRSRQGAVVGVNAIAIAEENDGTTAAEPMSKTMPAASLSSSNTVTATSSSTSPSSHSLADSDADQHSRRLFLGAMLSTSTGGKSSTSFGGAAATSAAVVSSSFSSPTPTYAYERSFPDELSPLDMDGTRDLAKIRSDLVAERRAIKKRTMDDLTSNPTSLRSTNDYIGSIAWAGALWLLSGSRSNPLITPLANALYDPTDEPWLKDRNDGLFAPLPPALLLLMGVVFAILGVSADRTILFLTEGDSSVTLQLAGVALIGGGALELGRIASGEKGVTRDDSERTDMLVQEFDDFATKRLKSGGNCHRSEVVAAYRRFYAKYRVENDDYPLTDLEIERLMRRWTRVQGHDDMSSAGFFVGVQLNKQADVTTL